MKVSTKFGVGFFILGLICCMLAVEWSIMLVPGIVCITIGFLLMLGLIDLLTWWL